MGSTFLKAAMFSDADLVQLVRIKSRTGMTMIYDAYAQALFLAIFRILPVRAEAEEILEQTFHQIYRSVEAFPIRDESFFTWTMMTARQLTREHLYLKQIIVQV